MPRSQLNWIVVRGYDIGPRTQEEAERFTRNLPNAYALRFISEAEAYRYWEHYYRDWENTYRVPGNWSYSYFQFNLRLHPVPNDLSNAIAIGTPELTTDTAGPTVRREGPDPLPPITPTPTFSHGLSSPSSVSTFSTSGQSTFTLDYRGAHLPPAAPATNFLGLRINAQAPLSPTAFAGTHVPNTSTTRSHSLQAPEASAQVPSSIRPTATAISTPSTPSTDYGFSTPSSNMLAAILDIEREYAIEQEGAAQTRDPGPDVHDRPSPVESAAQRSISTAAATSQWRPPLLGAGPGSNTVASKRSATSSVAIPETRAGGPPRSTTRRLETPSASAPPPRANVSASSATPIPPSRVPVPQRDSAPARHTPHLPTQQATVSQGGIGRSQLTQRSAQQPSTVSRSAAAVASMPSSSAPAANPARTAAASNPQAVRIAPPGLAWGWRWQLSAHDERYPWTVENLRPLPPNFGGNVPAFDGEIPVPVQGPWSDRLATASFYVVIHGRAPGIYSDLNAANIRFSDPGWFTAIGWPAAYAAFKYLDAHGLVQRTM